MYSLHRNSPLVNLYISKSTFFLSLHFHPFPLPTPTQRPQNSIPSVHDRGPQRGAWVRTSGVVGRERFLGVFLGSFGTLFHNLGIRVVAYRTYPRFRIPSLLFFFSSLYFLPIFSFFFSFINYIYSSPGVRVGFISGLAWLVGFGAS